MHPPIPDEQAALLAGIGARPDDDTARLVYADWLDEHGDEEQAAFVRQSIALARTPGAERELGELNHNSEEQGQRWLRAVGIEGAEQPSFDRGLVSGVSYRDANALLAEVEVLFARAPITTLWVFGQNGKMAGGERLPELFARPELARLSRLWISFGGALPPGTWNALMACPYLTGLKALWLDSCGLDSDHLMEFATNPRFAGLTELDLSDNPYTFMGQFAILRSPHLKRVTRLSLASGEDPEDEGLMALVSERFGSLDPLLYGLTDQ
jgi:uncharacterized protein (TIGR02996 family)